MSRGERWSRRDPDYRAGHRIGQVAGGTPPRRGCRLLALSLITLIAGLTLVAGSAGGMALTWWAG